jgi:hypothetical protein
MLSLEKLLIATRTSIRRYVPMEYRERLRPLVLRTMDATKVTPDSLAVLAFKHGTDKLEHGYLPHYERHFRSRRKESLNILEIGVGGDDNPRMGGGSLRMWREYFPNSRIFGVDLYDKSAFVSDRITIFQGSQNDPAFLSSIAAAIGRIDLVIDDGSHISEHIGTSFRTLFPLLSEAGMYVIEDLFYSYQPRYQTVDEQGNQYETSVELVKSLIDALHHQHIPDRVATDIDRSIASVCCYPKIVFIEKTASLGASS